MSDSNPQALFAYVTEQLNRFSLAYLHIIEPRVKGNVVLTEGLAPVASQQLRKIFQGNIIAAGGFEHNLAMRTQYLPQPVSTAWTLGADTNTGDGIQAGLAVGAAVALMDQAWWGPVIATPDQPNFCLAERTEPGGLTRFNF